MLNWAYLTCCLSVWVAVVESQQFRGIPGLYCGLDNCYDVLGATRESSKDEIAKLYRAMAKKWHPDRFKTREEKEAATERFRLIASAYETLRDPGTRQDYDDMMENPEDYYQHYYRYYKRAYGTKVDARLALAVLVTLVSAYQYWIQESRYNDALDFMMTIPRYRSQALDLATKRGLWPPGKRQGPVDPAPTAAMRVADAFGKILATILNGKPDEKKLARPKVKRAAIDRSTMRNLEQRTIREILLAEDLVSREGYAQRPDYKEILWIQLVLAPWSLVCYLIWLVRWYWKFGILGQPYGDEERIYLIRRNMASLERYCRQQEEYSLAPHYLTSLLPNLNQKCDLDQAVRQGLWLGDNFRVWRQKKEDEIKSALSQNACFKRYRRYMRKGGPGQISFLDD